MRFASLFFIVLGSSSAQFKSTTQLVVAPTTVVDSKGKFIDGLTPDDLILTDNNVPQTIQMDWMTYPIDLVVAVQTSANSGPVIDKLGNLGNLFSQVLASGSGETAILSYSDDVKLHQDFTSDSEKVKHEMRMFRMEGAGARTLDALGMALTMLSARPAGRRRIILMIGESRDRGSAAELPDVMSRVQKLNAAVYWITWSAFVQQFTVKNKVVEDLKPEAERRKFPYRDETPVPYEPGPGGNLYALGELMRMGQPDLAKLFSETTGGRVLSFVKKDALEQAVELIGLEVHRQYILTFTPSAVEPGVFHRIQVTVSGNPKSQVTTRSGYWAVE